MKIKKYKLLNKNDKLIKLKTLNLYSKTKQTNIQKFLLQTYLLKVCNIIYQYHFLNKRILFLGFPAHFKHIVKETKHKIIEESLIFNGIISNKEFISRTIKTKLQNIDLVIILNQNNYFNVEKESYTARIPTITLNNKQRFIYKTGYPWLSNYKSLTEKKITNNFFLISLKKILIKANQKKMKEDNI